MGIQGGNCNLMDQDLFISPRNLYQLQVSVASTP